MIYIGIAIIILLLLILLKLTGHPSLSIEDITPSEDEKVLREIKNVSRKAISKITEVDFADLYHDEYYNNITIHLYVKEHGDINYSYVLGFEDELTQEFKKSFEVKVWAHQGRGISSLLNKDSLIYKRI